MMTPIRYALLAASAVALAACGAGDPGSGSSGDGCVPNHSVFCDCPDGTEGVRTCLPEGVYGICDCTASIVGTPDAGTTDTATDTGTADAPTGAPDITLPEPETWEPTCEGGGGWGDDDFEERMYPGGNCIQCHLEEEDDKDDTPSYTAAGTVMLGLHEEDDCAGVNGAVVEITGADGLVRSLRTNSVGNFFTREPIPVPYTAVVRYDGRTLPMEDEQTDLNCANCHTIEGTDGAPGRIYAP